MKLIAFVILVIFSQFQSEVAFKINSRILNGCNAPEQTYPHYVFLEIEKVDKNWTGCGGTLLNDEFILTAAHCLLNVTAIKVNLGTINLDRSHAIVRVDKHHYFIHPDFDLRTVSNDIGLVQLPKKVEFTPHIQPVRLPTECELAENISVIIMGNGKTQIESSVSPQLQHALLTTIPFEICHKAYPFVLSHKLIICAIDQENVGRFMSSVCLGDSGSPLVKADGTLIGVTSFGRLVQIGAPQVFTRVSAYTKWINQMTGLNLPEC